MCGRFTLVEESSHIAEQLGFALKDSMPKRYNIAPSQYILVARKDEKGQGEVVKLKWGLLPSWVKNAKLSPKPINARAETAFEKPYFRQAFKKRRCLIPANGFYEWQQLPKKKQPFLIHMRDNSLFFMAGLWEHWISPDGEVIESATILTTNANTVAAKVHNRMPIILSRKNFEPWLARENTDAVFLSSLLLPFSSDEMDIFPVSTLVNSPKNDVPECLAPISA